MSFPSFRILLLLSMVSLSFAHQAQTPSNVEAAEYEPNSDRWFVSNGNSILVTADEGDSGASLGTEERPTAWRCWAPPFRHSIQRHSRVRSGDR